MIDAPVADLSLGNLIATLNVYLDTGLAHQIEIFNAVIKFRSDQVFSDRIDLSHSRKSNLAI